ncbi:hypothetical protein ACKWTF_014074 [Chironomus riparius]
MLHDLPDEVLIYIFNLFESPDIPNFTLVCKKFNDLISNSTQLMKNFTIRVSNKTNATDEWNGTRKYSRLIIQKMHKEVPEILEAISNNLILLCINSVSIDATELKKILVNCPKLLRLDLNSLTLNYDDGCFEEPHLKLDIDSLGWGSDFNILKMFMHCQIKSFYSYRLKTKPGELEACQNFLKLQKKLEKISFIKFDNDADIFNDDALNDVEFRLKNLSIKTIREVEIENFKKFLKNHQDSLQHLEMNQFLRYELAHMINQTEILDCVANFPNLKSLDLYETKLPTVPMPYIEKLRISGMCYDETAVNWSSKFPNVKELDISRCHKVNEIINFKKLETLFLSIYTGRDALDQISFPSTVKNLEVHNICAKNSNPFNFEGHQIENFIAKNLQGAEWIGDFLKSLKEKLKFLKIDRCLLSRWRRFSRLFEKEPELMNKAKSFVLIDWKDEYDEESVPSSDDEVIEDFEHVDYFAGFYQHDPKDEIDWEYLAYLERKGQSDYESDEDDDDDEEEPSEPKRSKLN